MEQEAELIFSYIYVISTIVPEMMKLRTRIDTSRSRYVGRVRDVNPFNGAKKMSFVSLMDGVLGHVPHPTDCTLNRRYTKSSF